MSVPFKFDSKDEIPTSLEDLYSEKPDPDKGGETSWFLEMRRSDGTVFYPGMTIE